MRLAGLESEKRQKFTEHGASRENLEHLSWTIPSNNTFHKDARRDFFFPTTRCKQREHQIGLCFPVNTVLTFLHYIPLVTFFPQKRRPWFKAFFMEATGAWEWLSVQESVV